MTTLADDEEDEELTPVDQDALERAVEICRTRKSPADRNQIRRSRGSTLPPSPRTAARWTAST